MGVSNDYMGVYNDCMGVYSDCMDVSIITWVFTKYSIDFTMIIWVFQLLHGC